MRLLSIFLCSYYGRGHGTSNELMMFGGSLFADLGFEHHHLPLEHYRLDRSRLKQAIVDARPDLIFVVPFEEVLWELNEWKPKDCKVLAWMCDDAWRFHEFTRLWLDVADYCVTTDPSSIAKYHELGYDTVILSNWAARPDMWHPELVKEQTNWAFFSGLLYGDRMELLRRISLSGTLLDVNDCGRNLMDPGDLWRRMGESRFTLSLNQGSRGGKQFKLRLFEPQCFGSVLVTDDVPGLSDYWTPGEECLVWQTPEEASELMYRLADADHARIAARAKQRLLDQHTFHHRFKQVFEVMSL